MVQRPFSAATGPELHNNLIKQSTSLHSRNITGHTQIKSVFNKNGLPKGSPVVSKIETGVKLSKHPRKDATRNHVDVRNVNHSFNDVPTEFVLLDPPKGTNLTKYEISNVNYVPSPPVYLKSNPVNRKSDHSNRSFKKNKQDLITMNKINLNRGKMNINPYTENTFDNTEKNEMVEHHKDKSKIDYSNQEVSDKTYNDNIYKHLSSLNSQTCNPLYEQMADIDAQQMYTEFSMKVITEFCLLLDFRNILQFFYLRIYK